MYLKKKSIGNAKKGSLCLGGLALTICQKKSELLVTATFTKLGQPVCGLVSFNVP